PATVVTVGSAGLDAADRLGQLKMAEDASIDFYSFIRSSYYQMRRGELPAALNLSRVAGSPPLGQPPARPPPPAPAPPARRGTCTQCDAVRVGAPEEPFSVSAAQEPFGIGAAQEPVRFGTPQEPFCVDFRETCSGRRRQQPECGRIRHQPFRPAVRVKG